MTGAVLLVGFFVEGVTILELHKLLVLHFVVGALLIGPVLLKIVSTMYRFARYYTGSLTYVRKGPPVPVLRLLGPFVILTSVAVLATGIVLAVVGPGNPQWMFLHKASFVLWFGVMTVHVVWYAPQLPRLLFGRSSVGRRAAVPSSGGASGGATDGAEPARRGGAARWLTLCMSLAAGIAVAAVTMDISGKWNMHL